ncbi:MAG: hypothetical protein NVS9B3_09910 [Gemmatimonadaceae bacterium]
MKAILLIDHGSKRDESNEMLACMAHLVQTMVGRATIVRHAHMELAEPSIAAGVDECVSAGATEVIAFPYMLSPGRHSTSDIPRLVGDAAARHAGVRVRVTAAVGVHEKLAEIILGRAEIAATTMLSAEESCRCWHPTASGVACGSACRLRQADLAALSARG